MGRSWLPQEGSQSRSNAAAHNSTCGIGPGRGPEDEAEGRRHQAADEDGGEMPAFQQPLHVHVSCAIIEQGGRVLAAQRSANTSLPLKWEFPGGKQNPGESARECLERELMEELGVQVTVVTPLSIVTHSYPTFTVTLYPFVCTIRGGELVMHEHAALQWLAPHALPGLDWAEADLPILGEYLGAPCPAVPDGDAPIHPA